MIDMVLDHPHSILEIQQPPLFHKDKKHSRIFSKDRVKLFQYNYNNKIIMTNKKTKPYGFRGNYPND